MGTSSVLLIPRERSREMKSDHVASTVVLTKVISRAELGTLVQARIAVEVDGEAMPRLTWRPRRSGLLR